jgi:hypothetical protein
VLRLQNCYEWWIKRNGNEELVQGRERLMTLTQGVQAQGGGKLGHRGLQLSPPAFAYVCVYVFVCVCVYVYVYVYVCFTYTRAPVHVCVRLGVYTIVFVRMYTVVCCVCILVNCVHVHVYCGHVRKHNDA